MLLFAVIVLQKKKIVVATDNHSIFSLYLYIQRDDLFFTFATVK